MLINYIFLNRLEEVKEDGFETLAEVVLEVGTGADAIQRAPIVDYDSGVRCVRVGDMTNKRPFHEWGFCSITPENYEKYKLIENDIVVTRTACNGLSYFVDEKISAVCNNGLIRLRVNKKYNPCFIYLLMQTKDFMDHINKINGETSTRPNMKIDYLLRYQFPKVSLLNQNAIVNIVTNLMRKRTKLSNESKSLKDMRDNLLPKLISGDIDLSVIELEV